MNERKWLVGVITFIVLSYMAWVGTSIITLWHDLASAEANVSEVYRWLERIERKLDAALYR